MPRSATSGKWYGNTRIVLLSPPAIVRFARANRCLVAALLRSEVESSVLMINFT